MRARNFSATTPFFITPDRVASQTIPFFKTSVSVFPCRSAVKIAIAFSSAERYNDTLNTPGACFPWREPPSTFFCLAIVYLLFPLATILYHKVCAHRKGIFYKYLCGLLFWYGGGLDSASTLPRRGFMLCRKSGERASQSDSSSESPSAFLISASASEKPIEMAAMPSP